MIQISIKECAAIILETYTIFIETPGKMDKKSILIWFWHKYQSIGSLIYIMKQIMPYTFSGGDWSEGLTRCSLIWSSCSVVISNLEDFLPRYRT